MAFRAAIRSFDTGAKMRRFLTLLALALLLLPALSIAACMEVNGVKYCGRGACVELNGDVYCSSQEGGTATIHDGVPVCGPGRCLEKDGNIWCSAHPGGGIIRHDSVLWSGPGECLIHEGNAYCAKDSHGVCSVVDGLVRCQGGWVREEPVLATPCDRALRL